MKVRPDAVVVHVPQNVASVYTILWVLIGQEISLNGLSVWVVAYGLCKCEHVCVHYDWG